MNYKNAKYNAYGTIDCEIEHPKYGWIPNTVDPINNVDLYTRIVTDNNIVDYVANIDLEKNNYKHIIDTKAEQTRLKFITDGAGQAMVYQEKAEEATDYAVAGYPADLSSYPLIQAEVNARGVTSTQAADEILAIRSAWIAVSAQIEEIRLGAKTQIDGASDTATIDTIMVTALTALDNIGIGSPA